MCRRYILFVATLVVSLMLYARASLTCVPRDPVQLRVFNDKFNQLDDSEKPSITANDRHCVQWESFAVDLNSEFDGDKSTVCKTYKPLGEALGPWCYVMYNKADAVAGLWDPCYPWCDDVNRTCYWYREVPMDDPRTYSGHQNVTVTGADCVSWWDVSQAHSFSLLELDVYQNHSECRSFPLPERYIKLDELQKTDKYDPNLHRPWCFKLNWETEQYEWEYCHPLCEHGITCMSAKSAAIMPYAGFKNTTISGYECLDWNARFIRWHPYQVEHTDGNFCRNKGRLPGGPWCLTTDPDVYGEFCFPHCEDELITCVGDDKMIGYKGTKSTTVGGKTCQRWDRVHPHLHHFSKRHFKVANIWEVSNFCRNPNADPGGPWCYTTDKTVVKDFCFKPCLAVSLNITLTDEEYREIEEIAKMQKEREGLGDTQHPFIKIATNIGIFAGIIFLCCYCMPKGRKKAIKVIKEDRQKRSRTELENAHDAIEKGLEWAKGLYPYRTTYQQQGIRNYFSLLEEYRQLKNFERNTRVEEGVIAEEEEEKRLLAEEKAAEEG